MSAHMNMSLNKLGLGGVDLNHEREQFPDVVPGRVAHIDGDFICYHATCHEDEDWETQVHTAAAEVERLRLMAGAERACLHLTSKFSDKGKRAEFALQRPYQGNRKDKPKPQNLERMRLYLAEGRDYEAMYWTDQEADDGMCQAAWQAVQAGKPQLAVIVSPDKDLRQCIGWHMDWHTGELHEVSGYGFLHLDRTGKSPKLVGYGPAFFWAQVLMGDSADNIQGLPKVTAECLNVLLGADTDKDRACGPVLTYELLQDCASHAEAAERVGTLYSAYGEKIGFTNYKDGSTVDWKVVLSSECILLWMRRTKDILDFMKWM